MRLGTIFVVLTILSLLLTIARAIRPETDHSTVAMCTVSTVFCAISTVLFFALARRHRQFLEMLLPTKR